MASDPFAGLDVNFALALQAMIKESGGRIGINNGYRSIAEQQRLYDNAIATYGRADLPGRQVAKPGSSKHNFGLAADLTGDLKLAKELGKKYGLHFPVQGEAWHVEPIGARKGGARVDDGLTLEPAAEPNVEVEATTNVMESIRAMISGVGASTDAVTGASGAMTGSGDAFTSGTTAPKDASQGQPEMPTAAPPAPSPGGQPATGDIDGLDDFMNRIGKKESGGNYNARNKDSGAFGKYQIMPSNWSSWAKEAGLPANAPQTPENQDRVARHKMAQYYKQFGSWDKVAKAWYSGPGNVNKNVSGGYGGQYPTSNQYANDIVRK